MFRYDSNMNIKKSIFFFLSFTIFFVEMHIIHRRILLIEEFIIRKEKEKKNIPRMHEM